MASFWFLISPIGNLFKIYNSGYVRSTSLWRPMSSKFSLEIKVILFNPEMLEKLKQNSLLKLTK